MGPFDEAWVIAMVGLSVPVLWAALGELISERAGVINIGLEGMVLAGAFTAFWATWATGSVWVGVLAAIGAGLLLANVMALFCIGRQADQIVVGLGLLLVAGGATAFAFQEIFAGGGRVVVDRMGDIEIPLLSNIPVIGPAFFDQGPLAYLAFLAVPAVYVLLWRTPWGLAVRAAGESPEAVEAGGLSVARTRWLATLAAGVGGALGGAMLTIGSVGVFTEDMSAGRGFIALAAVVFGRWNPLGVLGACLVFGGADALQLRLQAIGGIPAELWIVVAAVGAAIVAWQLRKSALRAARTAFGAGLAVAGVVLAIVEPSIDPPSQIWLMFPYVMALIVLAGLVGRARMPSAIGVPYRRASASA
jgi:general nucleoside transport system permease protein